MPVIRMCFLIVIYNFSVLNKNDFLLLYCVWYDDIMKTVHFVCRGNSFRSRIAEAYLKSLNIKGITVISSGTVAKEYSNVNGLLLPYTKEVLVAHNLLKYDKSKWDQLTPSRVSNKDITIFIGQQSYKEAKAKKMIHNNYTVWDIPDINENYMGTLTPSPTDKNFKDFLDLTYNRIKLAVDNMLLKQLV